MTSPLCGAFVKTFSVQCLTNGNAVSSAPEPMAELLGSCLRLQLLFRCVKLDANTGLEVPRAADGYGSRTGSGPPNWDIFTVKFQGTHRTL